ncbi:MAG: ROK family protein [Acidobacteria bacterium]|nr:MAG: ROK family protein [Acidobacteriota bacterium]
MAALIQVDPRVKPVLDPDFVPASLWNRTYREKVNRLGGQELKIALQRGDSISVFETRLLPDGAEFLAANQLYLERLIKFLLWQKGGHRVRIAGNRGMADYIRQVYSPAGRRAFDYHFMGEQVYLVPMQIEAVAPGDFPQPKEPAAPLGRHFNGCRIGFDLGGSDRKYAAVIDGNVVHTEEVAWDPYFKTDPAWHLEQISEGLKRVAGHLPRVDAIGGSAAGVYVNNEVRVASLFRGVPRDLFNQKVRGLFGELKRMWGGIPFVVVNDGEVTALAGSMSLGQNAILGIAMGTSLAAGYVTRQGNITDWLNELAFAPVDYRADAPVDEWSGDGGVGAQYFSQQAVARLAPLAGLDFPADTPLPARLIQVQKLMSAGDERVRKIYETIGVYFGYAVAHYADFYDVSTLLVLGRVLTGQGGDLIVSTAAEVLQKEFPELCNRIAVRVPDEKDKRLGQAVAAASLPVV